MDANRFDTLTRVVMTTRARRSVLRGLASAVLGGPLALLGLTGADQADAKKKGKNKKKKGKKKQQQPVCTPSCEAPMTCQGGRCDCPEPTVLCNGACYVNTCNSGLTFNPSTCECCLNNDGIACSPAGANASCCSGICGSGIPTCIGRGGAVACDFSAQCASGVCSASGFCFFP